LKTKLAKTLRGSIEERRDAKFLREPAKLAERGRTLEEIDEVGFYPSLRKEAKRLSRIRAFLDSEDLYFQRVILAGQGRELKDEAESAAAD
jgi:hypothetical protein